MIKTSSTTNTILANLPIVVDGIGEVADESEIISPKQTLDRLQTNNGSDSHRSFNTRLLMKAEDIIEKLAKKSQEREKKNAEQ